MYAISDAKTRNKIEELMR